MVISDQLEHPEYARRTDHAPAQGTGLTVDFCEAKPGQQRRMLAEALRRRHPATRCRVPMRRRYPWPQTPYAAEEHSWLLRVPP